MCKKLFHSNAFIALLLATMTMWAYWPAGAFQTVCYDDTFFTDAPEVRTGLNAHSFHWAMTAVVVANWHPVTSLSFVVMHQLFGANAGAEHRLNALIHAANAALLFLALRALVGRGKKFPADEAAWLWPCAAVAAMFAWHPLRVESVAWIAERKDVLCGFFFLLAIWFYAKHFHAKKSAGGAARFYWLALLAFALALLSKPMAVTLPFVLLLLDVWPLNQIQNSKFKIQNWGPLVVEKIPFFALTVVFCVLTFVIQRGENATPSVHEIGLTLRLENVVASYWRYLAWSLWPVNLAGFYSFPYDQHFYLALWPGWVTVLAAGALAAFSIFCFFQIPKRPYLAVGWFWYLGMMVPVIGLVQVGSQGMADRYTYLPLIGPAISLIWLLMEKCAKPITARWACGIFLGLGLCAALAQTRHQLSFWKNTEALCQRTIEVTGENPHAEYILGLSLENEGRLAEAMKHYANAIASQPRIREAFYALGRLFGQQGRWDKAELAFTLALGDNPNDFTAHLGLATALPHLNRVADAKTNLQAAIQLCPEAADALNNLAWALATSTEAELRDGPRAVTLAQRACELTGHQETIMVGTLGAAYAEVGKFDEAIAAARSACDLATKAHAEELLAMNKKLLQCYQQHQPYRDIAEGNATTNAPPEQKGLYALGRQLAEQGKWPEAARAYTTALGDNPNDFAAHLGLATTLPHLYRVAEAKSNLLAAIQFCPDKAEALNDLAWTLATSSEAELRDGARAVKLALRACELTGHQETVMVGTLGAAYAEAGKFAEAIAAAQSACDLATKAHADQLLAVNRQLLQLYQQQQPYREIGEAHSATDAPPEQK